MLTCSSMLELSCAINYFTVNTIFSSALFDFCGKVSENVIHD